MTLKPPDLGKHSPSVGATPTLRGHEYLYGRRVLNLPAHQHSRDCCILLRRLTQPLRQSLKKQSLKKQSFKKGPKESEFAVAPDVIVRLLIVLVT